MPLRPGKPTANGFETADGAFAPGSALLAALNSAHFGHFRFVFICPIAPQLPHLRCWHKTRSTRSNTGALNNSANIKTHCRFVLDLLSSRKEYVACYSHLCILTLKATFLVFTQLVQLLCQPAINAKIRRRLAACTKISAYFFLTRASCSGSPVRTSASGSCSSSASTF